MRDLVTQGLVPFILSIVDIDDTQQGFVIRIPEEKSDLADYLSKFESEVMKNLKCEGSRNFLDHNPKNKLIFLLLFSFAIFLESKDSTKDLLTSLKEILNMCYCELVNHFNNDLLRLTTMLSCSYDDNMKCGEPFTDDFKENFATLLEQNTTSSPEKNTYKFTQYYQAFINIFDDYNWQDIEEQITLLKNLKKSSCTTTNLLIDKQQTLQSESTTTILDEVKKK